MTYKSIWYNDINKKKCVYNLYCKNVQSELIFNVCLTAYVDTFNIASWKEFFNTYMLSHCFIRHKSICPKI